MWSPAGPADTWLSAYVLDFLLSAREQGVPVAPSLVERSAYWLGQRFAEIDPDQPQAIAAGAYAAWTLARAGRLELPRLRYFASRVRGKLPSAAAGVQLAAALSYKGERELAAEIYADISFKRPPPERDLADFGSLLRDQALVLAVATEADLAPRPQLLTLARDVAEQAARTPYLSTQEQAWLLRAAAGLETAALMRLEVDGVPVERREHLVRTVDLAAAESLVVRNLGTAPVYAALAVTGIPEALEPATERGFTIERRILRRDGTPADLDTLAQSEQLVVVIEGRMTEPAWRQALVIDLLPAGVELETAELAASGSTGELEWLGELSETSFTARRDDRFVAALDLSPDRPDFRIAYLARAVTPGEFVLPGVQVEDMYAPETLGRGAPRRVRVAARP
jgi:uncharacterized protein YfaS (alpha-2-macroglobulin family)